MTPLRQKMIDAMLVRGFAVRTQRSYLDAVIQLVKYYRCSPEQLTTAQLQDYFLYLAKERQLSPATCRLYLNVIRFLYLEVVGWDEMALEINTPKRKQRIPDLLSCDEVARLLAVVENRKHRMMLTTCYGCGLRVSELVALRVSDIDGERALLRVTQGKGGKDRQVLLSQSLLHLLRRYWSVFHPATWLFYGRSPLTRLSITTAQKVFQAAKQRAGIEKVGGIHSLRHAYATHQLAAGMPLPQLKAMLGHGDLHSTMRYLHWVPQYTKAHGTDLIQGLEVGHE
ncbi:integrase [Candidatus Tenderia electrophaga]|uniref:Integrase n=1 Tax=Candidatus Tenderia electrophaga TaxID=1748243 RepID=A0A0S2TCG9_9GAMM|nr:integrase [Candidatus Tenderia electrophaga]